MWGYHLWFTCLVVGYILLLIFMNIYTCFIPASLSHIALLFVLGESVLIARCIHIGPLVFPGRSLVCHSRGIVHPLCICCCWIAFFCGVVCSSGADVAWKTDDFASWQSSLCVIIPFGVCSWKKSVGGVFYSFCCYFILFQ